MHTLLKHLLVGGVLWYSSFAFGQSTEGDNFQGQQLADLVVLSEQLAQEVRELRGIVEEQGYELRKLQQQRLDDYRSLDQRIASLGQTGIVAAPAPTTPVQAPEPDAVTPALPEKEVYRQAYTLVKNRDFDSAVDAFQAFLVQFPEGNYAGNAYYWLGELYDLRADYVKAQQSMLALISQFPEHRKVPDAHYKLAKVFHKMGDADKAQAHANLVIEQFAASGATAVNLAREFLAQNYP